MNILKRLSAIVLLIVAISSCNVNNGFIQKRKYQKGYHISLKKSSEKTKTSTEKDELTQGVKIEKNEVIDQKMNSSDDNFQDLNNLNSNKDEVVDSKTNEEPNAKTVQKEKKIISNKMRKNQNFPRDNWLNREFKLVPNSGNTASKSNTTDNSELIKIILIVLLVLLALALIAKIGGTLGYLLGVVVLVVVIYFILKLLGVI